MMTTFHYVLSLLFLLYPKHSLAYPCFDCNTMSFNYTITIDQLPAPTSSDCQQTTADTGCFVRIAWFNDQTSQVSYGSNLGLPLDTVSTQIQREIFISSGLYRIEKYVAYICGTQTSTPCNTVENLKRSMMATTFPTDKAIQKFNQLITPVSLFYSGACYKFTNMTDNCPLVDLPGCQQCLTAVEYGRETNVCATCPADDITTNFFVYRSSFSFNDRTRSDTISLGCQTDTNCNSMNNIQSIRQSLAIEFDYNVFNSSASMTRALLVLLRVVLFVQFVLGRFSF